MASNGSDAVVVGILRPHLIELATKVLGQALPPRANLDLLLRFQLPRMPAPLPPQQQLAYLETCAIAKLIARRCPDSVSRSFHAYCKQLIERQIDCERLLKVLPSIVPQLSERPGTAASSTNVQSTHNDSMPMPALQSGSSVSTANPTPIGSPTGSVNSVSYTSNSRLSLSRPNQSTSNTGQAITPTLTNKFQRFTQSGAPNHTQMHSLVQPQQQQQQQQQMHLSNKENYTAQSMPTGVRKMESLSSMPSASHTTQSHLQRQLEISTQSKTELEPALHYGTRITLRSAQVNRFLAPSSDVASSTPIALSATAEAPPVAVMHLSLIHADLVHDTGSVRRSDTVHILLTLQAESPVLACIAMQDDNSVSAQKVQSTHDLPLNSRWRFEGSDAGSVNMIDSLRLRSVAKSTLLRTDRNGALTCALDAQSMHEQDSLWHLTAESVPILPAWTAVASFVAESVQKNAPLTPAIQSLLAQTDSTLIERILVQEWLSAALGFAGEFFKRHSTPAEHSLSAIVIHPALSSHASQSQSNIVSLLSALSRLVPVCSDYVVLSSYVQRHSAFAYGKVQHAFSARVQLMIQDYELVVRQLENLANRSAITLLQCHQLVQPVKTTMRQLAALCEACIGLRGGALLNALHAQLLKHSASTEGAHALIAELIRCSARPYLNMLHDWLSRGCLSDAFDEFALSSSVTPAEEKGQRLKPRFALADKHVAACILGADIGVHKQMVRAGMYIQVLNDCEHMVSQHAQQHKRCTIEPLHPLSEWTPYPSVSSDYPHYISKVIAKRYRRVSMQFVRLLLSPPYDFVARLTALQSFYLCIDGALLTCFLDAVESELSKRSADVSVSKLQLAFQSSVRTVLNHSVTQFAYADACTVALQKHTLQQQIGALQSAQQTAQALQTAAAARGFDTLTLHYALPYPLTMVVTSRELTKYQLLHRHIFTLKCSERALHRAWQALMQASKRVDKGCARLRGSINVSATQTGRCTQTTTGILRHFAAHFGAVRRLRTHAATLPQQAGVDK